MSTPNCLLGIRSVSKLRIPVNSRQFPIKTLRHLALAHNVCRDLPEGFWLKGPILLQQNSGIEVDPKWPRDDRRVKIGKTIRILQARLPTLLQSPLPPDILSPQISLHLFPSTHPHLPTVSGRVAYVAALWTSPLAWGRVPLVGNVRLEILSERMVKGDPCSANGKQAEQLVVRWRTCGKARGSVFGPHNTGIRANEQASKMSELLAGREEDDRKEFTGLFIFEFDEKGRIVSHTIEHVQSDRNWDKGVGARVVGLTDWLLGGLKGNGDGHGEPCPAFLGEQRRR